MAEARDEFSKGTIRILAQRAGYRCAQPDCRQLTVGPSDDRVGRITMVGVGLGSRPFFAPIGRRFHGIGTPLRHAYAAGQGEAG